MNRVLYLKHRLVGSPAEKPLEHVRWALGAAKRVRHPELGPLYREHGYVDAAVEHLLKPNWSCIDGGSHIGSVLSKFVQHCPGGHHLAIEPVPFKAAWLRERYPQVEVHQVAISDEAGSLTFYEDRKRPGFSGLREPEAVVDMVSYEVKVERLDDIVGDREINFVKLDLEGAELPAMRGAARLFARCRPALLFECGVQTVLDGFGYQRTDVWDFLHGAGYDVHLVQDFVFGREPIGRDEFRRAGTYPFPGFNFIALAAGTPVARIR